MICKSIRHEHFDAIKDRGGDGDWINTNVNFMLRSVESMIFDDDSIPDQYKLIFMSQYGDEEIHYKITNPPEHWIKFWSKRLGHTPTHWGTRP